MLAIALATILIHLATGHRYGFDRDELMALEDARHLAWGYVQYPPMTPFFGWLALKLFGTSLVGFRFFAALVQAIAVVLTASMAKHLGGGKWAQITAALAGVPFCLGGGALMQYISFDYICWVLVCYAMVRLLTSGDPRWWLLVGSGIGLGMLAKYTIAFLAVGVVAGAVAAGLQTGGAESAKSDSERPGVHTNWIAAAIVLGLLIFLPNLIWQWQHHFESLEFLRFIHQRDVQTGVTDGFFLGQLELTMFALPIALAGFCFYCSHSGYRALAWMYALPLILLVSVHGRDYYLAPAYPMLYAAGVVWLESRIASSRAHSPSVGAATAAIFHSRFSLFHFRNPGLKRIVWLALAFNVVAAAAVALPIAPVNSPWWKTAAKRDIVFPEEIGWEEFTESVAQVWRQIPPDDRLHAAILAGNYGELGALNLYGPQFGLPRAISGVNSSWERGYGAPDPQTVVVAGYPLAFLQQHFASCEVRARVWNKYGIENEETIEDPEIFTCHNLLGTWEKFWQAARKFA